MIRDYMDSALKYAVYDKLADDSFSGEIPQCPGTIAFGQTLEACRQELKGALQDWLISALRHGDDLPVINGLDLNGPRSHFTYTGLTQAFPPSICVTRTQ